MQGIQLPVELRLNPTKTSLSALHMLQESRQHPCGKEGPLGDLQLCLGPVWEGYACSKENLLNSHVSSSRSGFQSQGWNSLFHIGKQNLRLGEDLTRTKYFLPTCLLPERRLKVAKYLKVTTDLLQRISLQFSVKEGDGQMCSPE